MVKKDRGHQIIGILILMIICQPEGESGQPVCEISVINNVEITALAAPRPELLISAGTDFTQNTPQVEFRISLLSRAGQTMLGSSSIRDVSTGTARTI